jgi:DNA-binding XRE family transcriptional regulator
MWPIRTTKEFDEWFSNMAKSFDALVKRTTTKRTRERAARRTQELLQELLLSEIREMAGKSQQQVAEAIGIKQPSLSKLESQSDMQISTLQRIIGALGGKLEVIARFPHSAVKIEQFDKVAVPLRDKRSRRKKLQSA